MRPDGFAVVDGIPLCKIQGYRMPDGLIADEGRTARGTMRRDVLAMTRSWDITLQNLNGDEFARIYNHFREHMGRSLFWERPMLGSYDSNAVPVLVRVANATRHPGPSRNQANLGIPYLTTEAGDFITTEDGDRLIMDTLQPQADRDYFGGDIQLTITEVHADAPGGSFQNTPGSELLLVPGPQGEQGPQGPQGEPGSSVLVGDGAPPAALGQPGDVYVDALTGDLYELEDE